MVGLLNLIALQRKVVGNLNQDAANIVTLSLTKTEWKLK